MKGAGAAALCQPTPPCCGAAPLPLSTPNAQKLFLVCLCAINLIFRDDFFFFWREVN